MDDFDMTGELLRKTLDQIAWINKWLGGNGITLDGVKQLLLNVKVDQEVCIVDLGCGNGDMLRVVADYMRKENRPVKLIGIDANTFTIEYARQLSQDYPEISYVADFIPSEALSTLSYDIVLSTLFMHHFSNDDIVKYFSEITEKANIGVIVNDLHRSRWAIILFRLLTIFIPNPMVRQDGVTSILRGFRKSELEALAGRLALNDFSIRWKWAFRYQWIIRTLSEKGRA